MRVPSRPGHYEIGEFTTQELMVVSDPCYETPDQTFVVCPGRWRVFVEMRDYGGFWGVRVANVRVTNVERVVTEVLTERERCPCDLGVDAGMISFFEPSTYPHRPDGVSYEACCDAASPAGIVEGLGVVVSSGLGDGAYPLWVTRTPEGEVISLEVDFFGDDEV